MAPPGPQPSSPSLGPRQDGPHVQPPAPGLPAACLARWGCRPAPSGATPQHSHTCPVGGGGLTCSSFTQEQCQ